MRGLASFVIRGRLAAALVVAAAALLSLLIPPLLILSAAPVALITLRQGQREGGVLILLATAGCAILGWPLLANSVAVAAVLLLLFWVPLWLLASVLRITVSLAITLAAAAVLGVLGVLAFYLVLGDPDAWWLPILNSFKPVFQAAGLITDEAALDEGLSRVAPFMSGLAVANLLANLLFGLLLGRWWQALLFNPGGFRKEFHTLSLDKGMALITIVVFALALTMGWHPMANLALILGMIYTIQGIALVHGVVGKAKLSRGWLVGFYVLMLFVLPQMVLLLCMLGIIDTWVDIRSRIRASVGMS